MTTPEISLRPATADDCEFAYRTTRDTMHEYVLATWGRWNEEYQRRGIGSKLVERLLAEARSARLPLRLRVLRVNPAFRLYQRMGFRVVEATPERYFMEHLP